MGNTWSSWAEEEEENVRRLLRESTRKINVLVLGVTGSGKSSFLSTMQSCLTHNHAKELGTAGLFDAGENFTFRYKRYPLPDLGVGGMSGLNMPVFFDMPGMPNVDDGRIVEILRALLAGKIPVDEPILVAAGMDAASIATQYAGKEDQDRDMIDRVVLVHSCQMVLPENLIKAIKAACNEYGVTMFNVLSHADKKGKACTEAEIEGAVGTGGTPRSCKVELYHRKKGSYGKYCDNPKTNYYILLMWKALLNENYSIHSNHN